MQGIQPEQYLRKWFSDAPPLVCATQNSVSQPVCINATGFLCIHRLLPPGRKDTKMQDSEKHGTFTRKSRFNDKRDSYVDKNGDIVYLTWVQEGKNWRRREVCRIPYAELESSGQTDLVIWLDEQDHRWDLDERYAEEHADYGFRNKQAKIADQDTNDGDEHWATDAWDTIPDPHSDVFDMTFPEKKVEDPLNEKVADFLETLTENQRDLFISRYGMGIQLEEY